MNSEIMEVATPIASSIIRSIHRISARVSSLNCSRSALNCTRVRQDFHRSNFHCSNFHFNSFHCNNKGFAVKMGMSGLPKSASWVMSCRRSRTQISRMI